VSEPAEDRHTEREGFFRAAWLVAALTMLSRVLGLARDMVIVPIGGARLADAFWMAFSVPNLFRRLFGEGALSAAFVPVFTDVAETRGWERARLVLANAAGVLAAVLVGLLVLAELGLWAALALFPGEEARRALLQLTALMFPFMVTVCLLALGSAALHCRGHFAYPAAAPVVLNVGMIVAAAWLAPWLARTDKGQFWVIGAALVATGIAQLLGVAWLLRMHGLGVVPRLRPLLPEVKSIARMMAPMLVPLSVLQVCAFADRLIAWLLTATPAHPDLPLRAGVVRCLYAASRLYQLPLGVLAISVATVVFPLFARYAARRDDAGLREAVNRALRLCLFLGVPAGVGLMVLAGPTVSLIFQRGQFEPSDARRAAFVLQMYCLGMAGYFCNHVLLRAFFARKEIRTPLLIACVLAGANVILVIGGIFTPLRSGAVGAATACTQTANAAALAYVLRRRLGRIGGRKLLVSVARTIGATATMAAVVLALRSAMPLATAGRIVAVCLPAGAAAFAAGAFLLRCPELPELLTRRKRPGPDG